MAANVPANLRSADISRFAQRAAQVEKIKPSVAYWSYYFMVQQVLGKGLHNQDEECKQYTSSLMDKLEAIKSQNPSDDAILDEMAGQAYIEQFGLETFQRADSAMGANKVTKQTMDTFQASATFLDLVHIWGEPSPEITSKIKYAKFHALRIAKAFKAGEDPNLSNPAPIPPPTEASQQLDPNDPEVRALDGDPRRPRVETVPDDTQRRMSASATHSTFDQSLHPSREHSTAPAPPDSPMWPPRRHTRVEDLPSRNSSVPPQSDAPRSISPLPPPAVLTTPLPDPRPHVASSQYPNDTHTQPAVENTRQDSAGGGYFPSSQLPEVPTDTAPPASSPGAPFSPTGYVSPPAQHPPQDPQDFYTSSPPPPAARAPPFSPPARQSQSPYPQSHDPGLPAEPPPHHHQHLQQSQDQPQAFSPPPQQEYRQPPQQPQRQDYQQPPQQTQYQSHQQPQQQPQYRAPPPSQPAPAPMQTQQNYMSDDLSMIDASKHAKWAISALNFEDVPTAVKELREALHSLGAT